MCSAMSTLHRFPLVRSAGLSELEAGVAKLFDNCTLDAPRESRRAPFRSTLNYRSLQHVALQYGSYGGPLDAKIGPYNSYVQGFPLAGDGEHIVGSTCTQVSVASGVVISPGDTVNLRFRSAFDHFVLIFSSTPLLKKLESLIGMSAIAPLTFIAEVNYERPAAQSLRRLVLLLAEELSSDVAGMPPLALEEFEQTLLVSYLCSNENNYTTVLSSDSRMSAPWQVRRAEEYIAANWDRPLTIEALSAATNVSARSLFHSFKKARGYSPMALVKQTRLDQARKMLLRPEPSTSVTSVGHACGFGNLGHFAADYFARFGERPSSTLRRSR